MTKTILVATLVFILASATIFLYKSHVSAPKASGLSSAGSPTAGAVTQPPDPEPRLTGQPGGRGLPKQIHKLAEVPDLETYRAQTEAPAKQPVTLSADFEMAWIANVPLGHWPYTALGYATATK